MSNNWLEINRCKDVSRGFSRQFFSLQGATSLFRKYKGSYNGYHIEAQEQNGAPFLQKSCRNI